jgi:small subunit ribosomal protein S17e
MDRVKRISMMILERYPEKFGPDFNQNKAILKQLVVVRSKVLRNRIAGYITSQIRKENPEKPSGSRETTESEIEQNRHKG